MPATLSIDVELRQARSTPRNQLRVIHAGSGTGTVVSTPAGIACPGACAAFFPVDSTVSLDPAADPGSTFIGWSGDAAGSDDPLAVLMNADKVITATFDLAASVRPGFLPYWIQDAADAVFKYNAIFGNNFWTATLGDVQAAWPLDSEITEWTINLPSALPGGASLTFALNLDGVTTGFTVTIGAGQTSGTGSGSLVVAQDQLLAQELVAISGIASKVVSGGVLGYES